MSKELTESFIFEPHNGFGGRDPDTGEPWPFGYISTSAPQPIFELNVILGFPREELLEAAREMAAARDMKERGEFLLDRLTELEATLKDDEVARQFHGHVAPAIARFRFALSKATGEQS